MFDGREYQCYFEWNGIKRYKYSDKTDSDKEMEYKIPFNSLSYGITSQPRTYFQGKESNYATMHSLTIVRDFDYMSPHLSQSVPSAKNGTLEIEIYKTTSQNDPFLFIKYELRDVQVVSIQHDLDCVTGNLKEVITISYNTMLFDVTPIVEDKQYSTRYSFGHKHPE